MSWENGRQLASITYGNNKTATFKYNSDGMRTYKNADGEQTYYYYDSENNLIALDKGSSIAYFYYDSNGQVTSMSHEEILYFFIKNQQGDIEKIVNNQGQVYVSYTYDACGNVISEDAITINSSAHVKDFNPFRYRGYVYDKETGLYYLQSRYYDPQTGRFLNADNTAFLGATGTALSCNAFTYCENNAINNVDYTGQFINPMNGYYAAIETAKTAWISAANILKSLGLKFSAYFLKHSIKATPKDINLYESSKKKFVKKLIKAIKNYKGFLNKLKQKVNTNKPWDTYDFEFSSNENFDLFGAFHWVDVTYNVCLKNGIQYVVIVVKDFYDFALEEFNSIVDIANNAAYLSQNLNIINNYKISITFSIRRSKLK